MVLYRDLQVAATWPQKVKKNARKEKLAPAAALIVEPPRQGPVAWEVEMSKGPSKQKKKRRAVQRQAKAQSLAPSKYVNLRMASVSNATLKRYQQVKGDFVGWQRKKKIKDKYKALESYLEHLYLVGEDLSLGTYTVAALVHFEPEMKSHPSMPSKPTSPRSPWLCSSHSSFTFGRRSSRRWGLRTLSGRWKGEKRCIAIGASCCIPWRKEFLQRPCNGTRVWPWTSSTWSSWGQPWVACWVCREGPRISSASLPAARKSPSSWSTCGPRTVCSRSGSHTCIDWDTGGPPTS